MLETRSSLFDPLDTGWTIFAYDVASGQFTRVDVGWVQAGYRDPAGDGTALSDAVAIVFP